MGGQSWSVSTLTPSRHLLFSPLAKGPKMCHGLAVHQDSAFTFTMAQWYLCPADKESFWQCRIVSQVSGGHNPAYVEQGMVSVEAKQKQMGQGADTALCFLVHVGRDGKGQRRRKVQIKVT